jgi:formiminotetrahydrofolate cyclodeaminase
VLQAYRLPKESDEQKSERAAKIQIALRCAVDVPLETAVCAFDVLKLLRELADIGTPNALSDVAVGARLAEVAIKGASYNVAVNLGSLSDGVAADKTREQMTELIDGAQALAEEVEAKMKI